MVITSPFGWRTHPVDNVRKLHTGIDVRMRQGSPVQPTAVGVVSSVTEPSMSRAGVVVIVHPWGWRTRYVHLSRVLVRPGQVVGPGMVIGRSGGEPGTVGAGTSTGPHLHLEVQHQSADGWVHIDPTRIVRR